MLDEVLKNLRLEHLRYFYLMIFKFLIKVESLNILEISNQGEYIFWSVAHWDFCRHDLQISKHNLQRAFEIHFLCHVVNSPFHFPVDNILPLVCTVWMAFPSLNICNMDTTICWSAAHWDFCQ